MADIDKPTIDVAIYDEGGNYAAGVDSEGRIKTTAEVAVEVKELTGFDNVADSWFFITNAGSAGDTIRVQIAAPDAVDVLSTLTTNEAGNKEKTALLIVNNLNADTQFQKNWVAKRLNEIVFIISLWEAEKGERLAANSLLITCTGTTTINLPIGNDVLKRRSKSAEIFTSPEDNRIGSLAFRGEVSSVIKAKRPIFISETDQNTSPSEIRMIVDRGLTNILCDPPLTPDDEVYLGQFSFNAIGKQVEFLVASGNQKGSKRTFLASEGGANRDTYLVDDSFVMKDHRSNIAGASYDDNKGAVLVVEVWNGTAWTKLTHAQFDLIDVWQNEGQRIIKLNVTPPPAGGNGIRINYAKLVKKFRVRVNVDDTKEINPSIPIKLKYGDFIVINATQPSAGSGTATANISGFPINAKTGLI